MPDLTDRMGHTTELFVATLCTTKRWAWSKLPMDGWYRIQGHKAYWDWKTGGWHSTDQAFLHELDRAFTEVVRSEMGMDLRAFFGKARLPRTAP